MKQAMGWLMAAVVAAGLNSTYHEGGLDWAHQVVDRMEQGSNLTLAAATGRADQFLSELKVLADRTDSAECPFSSTLDRVQGRIQARLDRTQARVERLNDVMSARQQAELNRMEAQRNRMEARFQAQTNQFKFVTAEFNPVEVHTIRVNEICPRIRIRVPQPPTVKIPSIPVVHVSVGPI